VRFLALVAVALATRLFVSGARPFAGLVFVCRVVRGDMWFARLCPDCKSLWPSESDFFECPGCGVKTLSVQQRPMTTLDANRRLRGIEFEREYQARERDREARGEPSPEDVGRAQAAEDIAEIRRLEQHLSNGSTVNGER